MQKRQSQSGVSLSIQKTISSAYEGHSLVDSSKSKEFTIKIANTLQEREEVFRLAYQVYLDKKFIKIRKMLAN